MTEWHCEPLRVVPGQDGYIRIKQVIDGEEQTVLVTPDQVAMLKMWLDNAAQKLSLGNPER